MSVPRIRNEFHRYVLSEQGLAKTEDLALVCSNFLDAIEDLGVTGRALALVTTKLQEAHFFAEQCLAADKGNHE